MYVVVYFDGYMLVPNYEFHMLWFDWKGEYHEL